MNKIYEKTNMNKIKLYTVNIHCEYAINKINTMNKIFSVTWYSTYFKRVYLRKKKNHQFQSFDCSIQT